MSETDFERGFAAGFERGFLTSNKSADKIEIVGHSGPAPKSISGIMGEWQPFAKANGCKLSIDFYTDSMLVEKDGFGGTLFSRKEFDDGICQPVELIERIKEFAENPLAFHGRSVGVRQKPKAE